MLVSEDRRWEAGYWVVLKKKKKKKIKSLKRRRKGVGLARMGNAKVGS